jgi:hypothetical protein
MHPDATSHSYCMNVQITVNIYIVPTTVCVCDTNVFSLKSVDFVDVITVVAVHLPSLG